MSDDSNQHVAVLILAAGSSSRLGRSKQLLSIEGEPLLVRMIREALHAFPRVAVVLGAGFEEHAHAIRHLPVEIINHPGWSRGMGSSIKAGFAAIEKKDSPDGLLIMTCDQPALRSGHLQALAARGKLTGKPIVASAYAGTYGVPAWFGRPSFELIRKLGDEEGAGKVIRSMEKKVESVPFPGGETDLDTPGDVENYRLHRSQAPPFSPPEPLQ